MRYIATLIALVAVASMASAAMTGGWNYTVDPVCWGNGANGHPGAEYDGSYTLPGYVANDLSITTTLDWTSMELIVSAPGAIYQNAANNSPSTYELPDGSTGTVYGVAPPPSSGIMWSPDSQMEFDSSFVVGDFSTATYTGPAAYFAGIPVCDTNAVNVNTFTTSTADTGTFNLARITIDSNFTGGSWSLGIYDASDPNDPQVVNSGTIVDGKLVPEPVTMLIMAIGGIGVLARRRRK